MAIFEAVRAVWVERGLDEYLPNGVYWGDPPPDVLVPYCRLESLGFAEDGGTNKSRYRTYNLSFQVRARDPAEAVEMVGEVANRLEDQIPYLPVGEGNVVSVDRGPATQFKVDEVTWAGLVAFQVRRVVRRTRPDRDRSSMSG